LLSSGCLSSFVRKTARVLRPWRIRQGLFLCASRRPQFGRSLSKGAPLVVCLISFSVHEFSTEIVARTTHF
jgi:hypothetical protein